MTVPPHHRSAEQVRPSDSQADADWACAALDEASDHLAEAEAARREGRLHHVRSACRAVKSSQSAHGSTLARADELLRELRPDPVNALVFVAALALVLVVLWRTTGV
jgi:hypothetical protein